MDLQLVLSFQEELKTAEEAVKRWQLLTASEARLAKAMRDGSSSTVLTRVLQVTLHPSISPLQSNCHDAFWANEVAIYAIHPQCGPSMLREPICVAQQALQARTQQGRFGVSYR